MYERDESALFVRMGGGKTVISATAMQEFVEDGIIKRWLIFAPKRVAQITWPEEFAKWEHLNEEDLAVAIGTPKQRDAALRSDTPFVVINYENMVWFFENYKDYAGCNGICFDELGRMKNATSQRAKAYRKHAKNFEIRTGLTGIPVPSALVDMFGQILSIDEGRSLGKFKTRFIDTYYTQWGRERHQIAPRTGSFEEVSKKIAHLTYLVENADYEDQLPPLVQTTIHTDMPAKVWRFYEELKHEYVAKWGDITVVVKNEGDLYNKLAQIAAGFIYTRDGYEIVHTNKLDAFESVLNDIQARPLLVLYNYRAELDMLQDRWPAPYIGSGARDGDVRKAITDWNAGKLPILYGHPASMGHGLNLQAGGDSLLWYGQTWSYDNHDQTVARLRRSGQESDQVWSSYLVCKDTVDEALLAAVQRKEKADKKISELIRNA